MSHELQSRLRAVEQALAAERSRVARMRSTVSWRLTSPLRALRRLVERVSGRHLSPQIATMRPSVGADWCQRGLHWDQTDANSAWMKETAELVPCASTPAATLSLEFRVLPTDPKLRSSHGTPWLEVHLGTRVFRARPPGPGAYVLEIVPEAGCVAPSGPLHLRLNGLWLHNALAWIGRITSGVPLPRALRRRLAEHRHQHANRRLRLDSLHADGVECIFFGNRDLRARRFPAQQGAIEAISAPQSPSPPLLPEGLNIHGFFQARFGIGESVRCMARAALAAKVPCDLVQLRQPTGAKTGDTSFAEQLVHEGRHSVNVFHLDAPQSEEIDHHHPGARRGRRNIAYWAWELTEFPDAWVQHARFFDEVWCPSEFVRAALAAKLRQPVIAMPHAIDVSTPTETKAQLRTRLGLPAERFLFLFIWDLASTAARKNPAAVAEAFSIAFGKGRPDVGLVLKTHNVDQHPEAYADLRARVAGIGNVTLLTRTLPREEITALQAACDCFVSLHRSEGFGLAVAEAMALGKPVISTDWSATSEFVTRDTGCPVPARLVRLEETHGPYTKGQLWADADVSVAAAWMVRLAGNPEEAATIGARAAEHIKAHYSPEAIGQRYHKRLNAMRLW